MRLTKIYRVAVNCLFVFVVAATIASCSGDNKAEGTVVKLADKDQLSQADMYEAEFANMLSSTNLNSRDASKEACELCRKVRRLDDARLLLGRFVAMVIDAKPPEAICDVPAKDWQNYNRRAAWQEKKFFVFGSIFTDYLQVHGYAFENWEELVKFMRKYVDEILSLEKTLPSNDCSHWSRVNQRTGHYLSTLKGSLKTWLNVARLSFKSDLTQGLTEEQKADILRRFDELQKYTADPPDCHERKVAAK